MAPQLALWTRFSQVHFLRPEPLHLPVWYLSIPNKVDSSGTFDGQAVTGCEAEDDILKLEYRGKEE